MITKFMQAFDCKTMRTTSTSWLLVLASWLVLSLGAAGCGATQQRGAHLADPKATVVLPTQPESLRQFNQQPVRTSAEAYLQAFTRLMAADYQGAQRALLQSDLLWDEPALRVGRLAFLLWNYANFVDLEPLRAWTRATENEERLPIEAVLFNELTSYLAVDQAIDEDAEELPAALSFGGAASWTVYGPVSSRMSTSVQSIGEAGEVECLQDLPLLASRTRYIQTTRVGSIGQNRHRGAVAYYESFLRVDEPTTVILASVGAQDYFSVWVNDTLAMKRYAEDRHTPYYQTQTLRLEPGVHRVLMKLGSQESSLRTLRVVPVHGRLAAFAADVGPASGAKAQRVDSQPQNLSAWFAPLQPKQLLPWLLAVSVGMIGDEGLRQRAINMPLADEHPLIAFLRANLLENAEFFPVGRAMALQTLRGIDDAWSDFEGVEMMAVQLEFTASDDDTAPQRLAARAHDPESSPHLRRAYASMVGQLGYDALAFKTLQQLTQEYPQWCAIWREYLQRAVAYRGLLTEADFEGAPQACHDVRQLKLLATQVWRGESADYNAFLARERARQPDNIVLAVSMFWQHLQTEGPASAEAYLQTLLDSGLREETLAPLRAMLAFRLEGTSGAIDALRAAVSDAPYNASLQGTLAGLAGTAPVQDLRVDSLAVLDAYRSQSAEQRTVADIVYVLDYGAWRFFEAGGGVKIVHQLFELNSREAISSMGEMAAPANALTLELRVIKPDGSVRTPVQIAEKDSLSLPDLEIGDVVEIETMAFIDRGIEEPASYTTGGFFFQSHGAPMFLSEMVVEYPADWGSDAQLEVFHFTGEHQRTRRGAYIREQLTVNNSPTMVAERWTPDPMEFFPWATFSAFVEKDRALGVYEDYIASRVAPSPEIDRMRAEVLAGIRGDAARVEALFRFVSDEIEMSSGFFGISALETARMQRGDRMSLLFALLKSAGYAPQACLIDGFDSARYPSKVFRSERFDAAAIYVEAAKDAFWLDPNLEFAPFNVLQSYMQGGEAVVIAGSRQGEILRVPEADDLAARNRSVVEIWLDENGDARIVYAFHYSPDDAAGMRDSLRYVPSERERVRYMEQFLSANYGPATLHSLVIEGELDADAPLVFHMKGRIDGLATTRDNELFIDRAFEPPAQLLAYTASSTRTLPLFMDRPTYSDMDVTVHPPESYRLARALEPVTLSAGDNRYVRETRHSAGETVQWKRSVTIQRSRVSSVDYDDLAHFAQQIRETERVRLQWTK